MAATYLHGVEVIDVQIGIRPVRVVKSSVPAVVGIAPHKNKNELFLVSSATEAAEFGLQVPGFTIPQALAAIFANQPTPTLVVNVFDPATHTSAVVLETVVIANGKCRLAFPAIGAFTAFTAVDGITSTGAVLGTDYTVNDYGDIVVLDAGTLPDDSYKISYKKLNLSSVTDSNIIGSVSGDGTRTGLKVFQLAYNTFRFKPKQIIAPGFTDSDAVCDAIQLEVDYYKAIGWVDAEVGTTVTNAIAGRNPAVPTNFHRASKRLGLLFNRVRVLDEYTGVDRLDPAAAYVAGVVAATDLDLGYWYSPSNKEVKGITGLERILTWDIGDKSGTTEANRLNEAGIVTIVSGDNNLLWGNSSSAFPSVTTPDQFICVQRTRDIVEESITYFMLPFMDAPILAPQIESVVDSVNSFMRDLIGRGALIEGSVCVFDPSLNSASELALGHIVFTLTLMPPTPGQRITFNSSLDISLLKNLLKAA